MDALPHDAGGKQCCLQLRSLCLWSGRPGLHPDHGLACEAADGAATHHHPGAPLRRGSPAFRKCDLQFSSLVHDLALRPINTKDRVRQAAFTLIIHHPPHLPRENFAGNLRTLSW